MLDHRRHTQTGRPCFIGSVKLGIHSGSVCGSTRVNLNFCSSMDIITVASIVANCFPTLLSSSNAMVPHRKRFRYYDLLGTVSRDFGGNLPDAGSCVESWKLGGGWLSAREPAFWLVIFCIVPPDILRPTHQPRRPSNMITFVYLSAI